MKNNIIGIYKITSPSGKIYIGQSWDIGMRKYKYKSGNLKGQVKLTNSFNKYSFENHKFEIIHILPKDITQSILDNYEDFYLNQYKDLGFKMLNSKGAGSYGKHSQETKDKISKINKGRIRVDNIERNKRMVFTEEIKNKMRLAKLGNKNRLGGKKYLQLIEN